MRATLRLATPLDALLVLAVWAGLLVAVTRGQAPVAAPAAPASVPGASGRDDPTAAESPAAEALRRKAFWNSRRMLAARVWLDQYLASSGKHTPQEADAYVQRLERLPLDDQLTWLMQVEALQARMALKAQRDLEAQRQRLALSTAAQRVQTLNAARISQAASATPQPGVVPTDFGRQAALARARQREASRDAALRYQQQFPNTFLILNYLDTLEVREELRRLRDEQ